MNMQPAHQYESCIVPTEAIYQFLEETDCWKRSLDVFKKENEYLKVRLANLCNRGTNTEFAKMEKDARYQLHNLDKQLASCATSLDKFSRWLETLKFSGNDSLKEITKQR